MDVIKPPSTSGTLVHILPKELHNVVDAAMLSSKAAHRGTLLVREANDFRR